VLAAGAAKAAQSEIAYVFTAFDRDFANGISHAFNGDSQEPRRDLFRRNCSAAIL